MLSLIGKEKMIPSNVVNTNWSPANGNGLFSCIEGYLSSKLNAMNCERLVISKNIRKLFCDWFNLFINWDAIKERVITMQLGIKNTQIENEAGESMKIKQCIIKYKKKITPSVNTLGAILIMFNVYKCI